MAIDGKDEVAELIMLNTASVGVYPNLVRRRERLQPALGKPLAGLVAGLRTFGAATPTTLLINGVHHKLWILYLGRGRYYPRDLAPLTRPVLDDGVLDIRMVTADEPFARLRLLWAVLTGTVGTSKVTHLSEAGGAQHRSDRRTARDCGRRRAVAGCADRGVHGEPPGAAGVFTACLMLSQVLPVPGKPWPRPASSIGTTLSGP